MADVFEHADRHDTVELIIDLAIVLHSDLDGQIGTHTLGVVGLLVRNREPHHVAAITFGEEPGRSTPATTHVENAHPGPQIELAGDQVELVDLRFRQ